MSFVGANNGLGNTNWNIWSRQSGGTISHFNRIYRGRSPERDTALARSFEQNSRKTIGLVVNANARQANQREARSMKSYKVGPLDRNAVEEGYRSWLSKESGKKNRWRVIEEYGSEDALISEITEEIASRTLKFRPIYRYLHYEAASHKYRWIGVESVKQQVVDHTLCAAMKPFVDKRIGYYQVASVEGKGQKLSLKALRKWSKQGGYFVKADIRKCYPSTRHDVVRRILFKYIRSDDFAYVVDAVLDTYDRITDDKGDRVGLEIGSYFSLRVELLILSFAYHFVEGQQKTRRGKNRPFASHQIWHMDDLLIMSNGKRDLRVIMGRLCKYLSDILGFQLKPWKLSKLSDVERLDLSGWVAYDGIVVLREGIFLKSTRAAARYSKLPNVVMARKCTAYWGWIKVADCRRVRMRRGLDWRVSAAKRTISRYDRSHAVS